MSGHPENRTEENNLSFVNDDNAKSSLIVNYRCLTKKKELDDCYSCCQQGKHRQRSLSQGDVASIKIFCTANLSNHPFLRNGLQTFGLFTTQPDENLKKNPTKINTIYISPYLYLPSLSGFHNKMPLCAVGCTEIMRRGK